MPPLSHPRCMTVHQMEFPALTDPKGDARGQVVFQVSFPDRTGECRCYARFRPASFGSQCGITALSNWRALASSETTVNVFHPAPSSVFDTRLYSVTGSGHIRRPAALGLLLRYAPIWVSVPPKTSSLQDRSRTPSKCLLVPSEKADLRHLGAGPTPVASPCVTRVNSGIQNGEQKCI